MSSLISVRNVKVSMDEWSILKGISWDIREGEHCLVVGPSGSGKSTLLGVMGGLIAPTEGRIDYKGAPYPSPEKSAVLRRSAFGFLFQDFHLIEHMTVEDNIGLIQAVTEPTRILPTLSDLLQPLGLEDRKSALVGVLSRGERQRVALARAFANGPEVLLADEPTASLDPESASETLAHLWNMCDHLGTTAVVVSHDRDLTRDERFADVQKLVKGCLEKDT